MASRTSRKGSKIVKHRVPKKPVTPLTEEEIQALTSDVLTIADGEGHPTPPSAETKVSLKRTRASTKAAKPAKAKPAKPAKAKPAKAKAAPAAKKAHKEGVCSICGKPLSQASSVEAGMGDICQHKVSLLPSGMDMAQYRASLTTEELPKGAVKLRIAVDEAHKLGIGRSRFLKAVGGDRHLLPPLNDHFKTTYHKGARYLPGSVLKHLTDIP